MKGLWLIVFGLVSFSSFAEDPQGTWDQWRDEQLIKEAEGHVGSINKVDWLILKGTKKLEQRWASTQSKQEGHYDSNNR